MVNYVKTKNGYFYKICKNSKKRISEDEYNKQIKIKKMTGGIVHFGTIINTTNERTSSLTTKPALMENVFKTGFIINRHGTKSLAITRVKRSLMELLENIKLNFNNSVNNRVNEDKVNIAYLGEIKYHDSGRIHCGGISNIWIQVDIMTGKVNYIVEIIKSDDLSYENHVWCALQELCSTECTSIIKALQKLNVDVTKLKNYNSELNQDVEIRKIAEIDDKIKNLNQQLKDLKHQKSSIIVKLYSPCKEFNWSFSINKNSL